MDQNKFLVVINVPPFFLIGGFFYLKIFNEIAYLLKNTYFFINVWIYGIIYIIFGLSKQKQNYGIN